MKTILFLMCMSAIITTYSQVTTNFNNPERISSTGKFKRNFPDKDPHRIPQQNIAALLRKEVSESRPGEAKPFTFAVAMKQDIDVVKEAAWSEDDTYAHGKYTMIATGAKTISASFDKFNLPENSELYIYSADGEMITGPVTERENNAGNHWGSWAYKGESLTVEFRVPSSQKSKISLHLSSIGYGYKQLYVSDFGQSKSCNVNVLCAAGTGWENERNSVALILNGTSTALCSGALIANTCNEAIPFFLTANHCFDGNRLAESEKLKLKERLPKIEHTLRKRLNFNPAFRVSCY